LSNAGETQMDRFSAAIDSGTIVNGKRFAMKPDDKKGAEWWVEEVKVAPAMEAVA
jgi:hypothetical protein